MSLLFWKKKLAPLPQEYSEEIAQSRIWVIIFTFLSLFLLLTLRLCELTFFEQGILHRENLLFQPDIPYIERAEIRDRHGTILATNVRTASLYAHPEKIIDKKLTLEQLKEKLPSIDVEHLLKQCDKEKRFLWIKRSLSPQEQDEVNRLGLPGLFFTQEEKRIYPHENLTSHLIGYVDVDRVGIAGIEKEWNDYLTNPKKKPLMLSLDIGVQHIVRETLLKYIDSFQASGGIGIVMDAKNGEIIAMVSLPDFDPHRPGKADAAQKFNQATLSVFEVGSIMKPLTFAMGLDSGSITLQDNIDVLTPLRSANYTIHDYHPSAEKWLTVAKVFMQSSNIGTGRIAIQMGTDIQKYFLELFGLFSPLAIEIPEKTSPLVPSRWSEITTITVAYGHGIAVTPLHMVQAMAPIVNGGKLYPATLIKKKNDEPNSGRRVINSVTSRQMRQLLRLVVEKGTGRKANVKGYMPGGKTGSAEKPEKGKYNRKALMASFIGAFPMHDPQYIILAMLDTPKGNASTGYHATGGQTAAPIIRDIISLIGPFLKIPPIDENNLLLRQAFWTDYMYEDEHVATF